MIFLSCSCIVLFNAPRLSVSDSTRSGRGKKERERTRGRSTKNSKRGGIIEQKYSTKKKKKKEKKQFFQNKSSQNLTVQPRVQSLNETSTTRDNSRLFDRCQIDDNPKVSTFDQSVAKP